MPARSRLSRFLFGPPFLVLLALFGCETTEVSRSDSQLHIFAGRDYTSTDLQLRLKPREGILTMQDGENFVGDNAAITTALMLDPGGIATVFAFPLPDDRISVEAMAVGFGRMLQNGFAELSTVRSKARPDLAFPAREYRISVAGIDGSPIDLYYTVINVPGRAVLIAENYRDDLESIREQDPALRSPFQIEDLGGTLAPSLPERMKAQHALFLNGMGLYYADRGNSGRALDYFARAWEQSRDSNFLFNYGIVAINRGEPARVVSHLEDKYEEYPDDVRLSHLMANAYVQVGRHEEGLELFKGLLTDGVVNPEILGNYFGALAESGRTEELREAAKPYLDSEYSELATIWTAVSWRNEGDPEAAWKVIEPDLGSLLEDPETTIFVIDVTLQRGEYADALTYAEEALANTGNKDFEFHRGIALLNLGQFAGAREAFEATLAANPGHADARSLLSQVINLLGQNDPSLYNSPIEAVALCPEIEAYKGKASEEYLAQTGALTHRIGEAVSWEPGKPLRVTRYSRVTVRDRDALARLKERVIPFDPLAQRVYVNQLDVFDADGKLVAEGNPSQYYLSDPQEDSVIDTRKSLHLPIPGLLVGGSYELAFTIEYQGGTDILYFTEYCFSNLYPREVSFFQFTGALDRVAVHTNSPSIHALDAEDALLWVADEPPVFENHAFLPLYSEYMPMIRIADAKDASWQKLAHTYAEELAPVMGETPENIATEAAALNIGDGSPEAIVKAVSDLLSERYTYTALNFGRHATQPHDPAEICQNRFGDCKDFTVAMHHYLKALGIDSVPALVRSGRGLVEELPSMDQFDHMVLYVPVLGENPLVDPSDGHMAIGQTPRSVLGEPILPISADSEGLLPPAGFSSADNNVTVDRTLVLQEDGTIKGEETAEFSGYIAAYLRDVLTPLDPEDHLQSVEDLFMGSGLNLDILSFESPNLHEMNETLQVHLRYQKERALFEAERDLIGQLTPSWDYLFFRHQRNERDRTQPVEVYHPASIANQTTVSWPASMHLASSLEELNGETVTPFGTLDFKLTPGAPHEFRYAANATLRHGTYEAAAYLPLTEYFEKVRRSLTPTVRLQMPEATKD